MTRDITRSKHESYGILQISRVSHGKETVLFGSSIPHRETIRLSIHPGELNRSLSHDWYYAKSREYIEIEMSQAQFAEAITSLNQGSGTPVTIRRLDGKDIDPPEFSNKRMIFEEEFKNQMQELGDELDALTESAEDILRNKKSVNKSDRQKILNQISRLKAKITSSIPFIASSYNEQLDKISQEAKAEVEAFTINKINQLGLEKLEDLKLLAIDRGNAFTKALSDGNSDDMINDKIKE